MLRCTMIVCAGILLAGCGTFGELRFGMGWGNSTTQVKSGEARARRSPCGTECLFPPAPNGETPSVSPPTP